VKFLDTNIFLRHLTVNEAAKAQACYELFQALDAGEQTATTSESVIAEVASVLRAKAHYRLAPAEIGAILRPILQLRGLVLQHKRTFLRAFDLWDSYPALDFEDVLTVAHMERLHVTELFSYDKDFDPIPGIERLEPTAANAG
jgi:predicted nucleic acid-binding protein